jgi:tetratricopeptide (TPR) repeat protein
VPSATPLSSAPAVAKGRDVCEHAADPCACAADEGSKLLAASFPERALQVVSHAPASCSAPALLGARAEALAAVERGPEASALAAAALAADPQNRLARRALAITNIQKGDLPAAEAALSKLATEDAKDADSLYYSAVIQRKGDHYNRAREGFLHVLRVNPQYVSARYSLVTLTASAGAAQEAEHHYQELLQIAPVGDPRLIAARTALHANAPGTPGELPVLHQGPVNNPSAPIASGPVASGPVASGHAVPPPR